jgi:ABC-2 type transport system permease protein
MNHSFDGLSHPRRRLVTAREDGVLRRWRATPLPRWCFFAGRIAATILLAVAGATITLLTAREIDGVDLTAGAVASLLVAVVLGALAWAAVGTAVTPLIPTTDSAQPLLALSFYPAVLLSGAFGPLGGQPRWLATLLRYLPAQPIVDAATRALQHPGPAPASIPGHDLTVLIGWTIAGLLASTAFFRWDPRRPRRCSRPTGPRRRRNGAVRPRSAR